MYSINIFTKFYLLFVYMYAPVAYYDSHSYTVGGGKEELKKQKKKKKKISLTPTDVGHPTKQEKCELKDSHCEEISCQGRNNPLRYSRNKCFVSVVFIAWLRG